jgi:hypothetical protein
MNAAYRAEAVLDEVPIEGISAGGVFRRQQFQLCARYEPQQRALARTDRAIAGDGVVDLALDFEGYPATVTTTFVEHR